MLNAVTRAAMRVAAENLMTDTCTIEVEDMSVGPRGEPTRSWSVVASGVVCRVIMAGSSNISAAQLAGSQEVMADVYRLVVPYGTALAVDQRVTVNSVVFHITRLLTERTDESDAQAIMERARGGG